MPIKCHNCREELNDQQLVVVVWYGDSQEWCYRCAGYDEWKKRFEPSEQWRSRLEGPSCMSGLNLDAYNGSGVVYSGQIGAMWSGAMWSGVVHPYGGRIPMVASGILLSGFGILPQALSGNQAWSIRGGLANPRILITDREED